MGRKTKAPREPDRIEDWPGEVGGLHKPRRIRCVGCGTWFWGWDERCDDCPRPKREPTERKDPHGALHMAIDRHFAGYGGDDIAVSCFTREAQEAFGVSDVGPWAVSRLEAYSVADRLRARYGPDAVFS